MQKFKNFVKTLTFVTLIEAMKINSIAYQRVLNLGNYESKRFEASAILDENDDPNEVRKELMGYVEDTLLNLVIDKFGEYHDRESGEYQDDF